MGISWVSPHFAGHLMAVALGGTILCGGQLVLAGLEREQADQSRP